MNDHAGPLVNYLGWVDGGLEWMKSKSLGHSVWLIVMNGARPAMDIPRSCCVLNLWFPRVCHLRQHSLLSPPPSHLSQVGATIIRQRLDSIAEPVFVVILVEFDRIWEEQACLNNGKYRRDGKSFKMLQETNFAGQRLGWGDHLTSLAPHHHRHDSETHK